MSIFIFLLSFLFLVNCDNLTPSPSKNCFRSAVYEHVLITVPYDNPLKILDNNFKIFKNVIRKASEFKTNIIVLPEYGLFPAFKKSLILSSGIASFIPKLGTNLCEDFEADFNRFDFLNNTTYQDDDIDLNKDTKKIGKNVRVNVKLLKRLSCLARENNIYVSINLIELKHKDEYLLYNTNLVFDNKGTLISKYRKFKLYGEKAMSHPKSAEIVTFDTQFGRFGNAICFDLLFKEPITTLVKQKKIDHLIYPTAWYNEEPSLSSIGFHSAVANKYQINILSANKRNLQLSTFGSGIYSRTEKVQTTFNNRDLLIIADLPIGNLKNVSSKIETECSYKNKINIDEFYQDKHFSFLKANKYLIQYKDWQTSFDSFEKKKLKSKEGKITNICQKKVCCSLEWKMNDDFNFPQDKYYLIASNKLKLTNVNESFWEENCALVAFDKKKNKYKLFTSTRFDKIILSGRFNSDVIFPNVQSNGLRLVPKNEWSFNQINNNAEISLEIFDKSIKSVTLYARNFDKDQNNFKYNKF